ncbi:MAG: type II toxin-antitoxin system RelB/DinJ family antitoxin [Lachnospiraceae bacterium]|nr:type II toxin-antitoxin system RelB/DinJ family antitoxin [Lachnospiraceae bacterium]
MAQQTFSIRMDEELKKEFDALCSEFGMTATTAFNVFARAVVRERRIPFEITSPASVKGSVSHSASDAVKASRKRKESTR